MMVYTWLCTVERERSEWNQRMGSVGLYLLICTGNKDLGILGINVIIGALDIDSII